MHIASLAHYSGRFMRLFVLGFLAFSAAVFAQSQALSQLVYKIRDPQTNRAQFRRTLEKIGENLALNVLEELDTKEVAIQTLTGIEAKHLLVDETPVLVTILRAGLPLNSGIQKVFPNSKVGFLAMARNEDTLKASVSYIALPHLENRSVIISDTMIGTGGSMVDAIQIVEQMHPKKIYVIAAIASQPGINRILENHPHVKIFSAAIDPFLNDKGYILPGLGDAGDRSYGIKHSLGSTESE